MASTADRAAGPCRPADALVAPQVVVSHPRGRASSLFRHRESASDFGYFRCSSQVRSACGYDLLVQARYRSA